MTATIERQIELTEFTSTDRDDLVRCLNDRWIYNVTLRIPHPYTLDDADKWIEFVRQRTEKQGQATHWALRDAAGGVIGAIGLEGFESGVHRVELGYWLAEEQRGKGLMTAAAQAVCRRGFDQLGLRKITAHVFHYNPASARVLQKCGFEQEGRLRQHYLKNGEFHDALLFARLK